MEVKIDLIRLGSVRKNAFQEKIILENVKTLKRNIKSKLHDIEGEKEYVTMIIPAKGLECKIDISSIKNQQIIEILIESYPNSIRILTEDEITKNLFNNK